MLEGLPSLKELDLSHLNDWDWDDTRLTSNMRALGVLKGTLEEVVISHSRNISGNLMDLADFPCLKELYLCINRSNVTGDILDISEHDFPALERLHLPDTFRVWWYGS